MLRYFVFALTEAITGLWRSRMLNLLSIGTVMFAMFILGSFVFVGLNLQKITIDWQEQIQFNVFLKDDVTDYQRAEIESMLEQAVFVDQSHFISKEEAQSRFGTDFKSYADALEGINENPFPASFQITLMRGVGRDSFVKLRDRLVEMGGIEEVYYDEEIYRRLDSFAGLIKLSGWFFGSVMIFSSIFTISNVLKLTFFTRREEVDIMKLVGASRAYIRGPFIVEGVLIGLLGSFFAVVLVYFGFWLLQSYITDKDFLFGNLNLTFLSLRWVLILVFSGAISGLLGSLISLNQFLEEHISYQ